EFAESWRSLLHFSTRGRDAGWAPAASARAIIRQAGSPARQVTMDRACVVVGPLIVAGLLASSRAGGQGMETGRSAAGEVVQKMTALEQSLDPAGWAARLTGPSPARDAVVARAKDLMERELLALADNIATHPEIGFEEKRSVEKLTESL